jgi:hypothetical protein
MIEFTGPLYNLKQHFSSHYLRLDNLNFWPHCTDPLLSLDFNWTFFYSWSQSSEWLNDWRFTANEFVLVTSPLRLTNNCFLHLNTCGYSPYVTPCPKRGWICRLKLLMIFASTVIIRSESRGTHDHIILSQVRDAPNLEGEVPVIIFSRNTVARLYPQALGSLLIDFYDSHVYGGGIRPRLHSWSQSHSLLYSLGVVSIGNTSIS